jgi:hypothetical protein
MIIMTMIIVFLVLCDGDPTLLGARMGLQENDQKGGCFSESYMASIVYLSVAFVSVIFLDMISTLYIYAVYLLVCVSICVCAKKCMSV